VARSNRIEYRVNDDELKDLDRLCSYFGLSRSEVLRKLVSDTVDRLDIGDDRRSILYMKDLKERFEREYAMLLDRISKIPKSKDEKRKAKHDTKRWRERDVGIKILESLFKDEMYGCGLRDYYDTYMNDLKMLDPEEEVSHYMRSNVVIVDGHELVTPVRRYRRDE